MTKHEITEVNVEAEQPTMAHVQLGCPLGSAVCDYKTEEVELASAMQLLEMHTRLAHTQQAHTPATTQVKTGKILRPGLELKDSFVDEETFAFFVHRWSEYKGMAGVSTDIEKTERSHCLSDEVQMLLFRRYRK